MNWLRAFSDRLRGTPAPKPAPADESSGYRITAASPRFAEGGQSRVAHVGYGKTYRSGDERRQDQEDGYCTTYTYWLGQVSELYRMLEARTSYGAEPCKTVLGHRVSFLAGEGVRIASEQPALKEWIEGWLRDNKLTGRMLLDAVQESEIVGHILWTLDDMGMVEYHPSFIGYEGWEAGGWGIGPEHYSEGNWEQPEWWPQYDGTKLVSVYKRNGPGLYEPWLDAMRDRFTFIRTGGHGNVARYPAPVTRMAAMIDRMKNLDRVMGRMRELNDQSIRQSPTVELGPDAATDEQEVIDDLNRSDWQPGDAVVTRGKFSMVGSDSGPVEQLAREAAVLVKSLSGTSAIPPHWLGYVDLMSNRATADSLFETVKSGTLQERLAWEEGLHDLITRARQLLGAPAGDFTVTMPLLSFHQFMERNEALLKLKDGNVISAEDIQGQLPFDTEHDPEAEEQRRMEMQRQQTEMNGPQGVVPREREEETA